MKYINKIKTIASILIIISVLTVIIKSSFSANTDLAIGRYALFMDERITFDGVKKILHPESLQSFLFAVVDGNDHRYGRILWNLSALTAFIPEKIAGEAGQIIASRMMQVGIIILSTLIFAYGILRNWLSRVTLVLTSMTLPFTSYFMTMPKPEPLMALFITTYFYLLNKDTKVSKWRWVFMGMAFGTKIAALPIVLTFFIAEFYAKNISMLSDRKIKNDSISLEIFIPFFIGIVIVTPILYLPIFVMIGLSQTIYLFKRVYSARTAISLGIPGLILAAFFSYNAVKKYIGSTVLATGHGEDSNEIKILSWLIYFFNEWLAIPNDVSIMFIFFVLGFLLIQIIANFKMKNNIDREKLFAMVLSISGIIGLILIMIGTKRLWGHYLYTGMLFLLFGSILSADLTIKNGRPKNVIENGSYFVSIFYLFLLIFISIIYWSPNTMKRFDELSTRTHTTDFLVNTKVYYEISGFLDKYHSIAERQLRIFAAPTLFLPETSKAYIVQEFWGPFTKWDSGADLIVLDKINTPRGTPTQKTSPNYAQYVLEQEGYLTHVSKNGVYCISRPCYVSALMLSNGGEILIPIQKLPIIP